MSLVGRVISCLALLGFAASAAVHVGLVAPSVDLFVTLSTGIMILGAPSVLRLHLRGYAFKTWAVRQAQRAWLGPGLWRAGHLLAAYATLQFVRFVIWGQHSRDPAQDIVLSATGWSAALMAAYASLPLLWVPLPARGRAD